MATEGCSIEDPSLVIVDDNASVRISTQRLIRSFDCLRKPFNEWALLSAIQAAVRRGTQKVEGSDLESSGGTQFQPMDPTT
jgi:DNA-binding response OmpR family regulator